MCRWVNSSRRNHPINPSEALTIPLSLWGHWLVFSVTDTNIRVIHRQENQNSSAGISLAFVGTHLRILSLTFRGAASHALTASSRVIPSVHLPQM